MNNSIRYGVATAALQHCKRHDQFHPANEQCPWCPPVVARKRTYQHVPAIALGGKPYEVVCWLEAMEDNYPWLSTTQQGPHLSLYDNLALWTTYSPAYVARLADAQRVFELPDLEMHMQKCGYTLHRLVPDFILDPNGSEG